MPQSISRRMSSDGPLIGLGHSLENEKTGSRRVYSTAGIENRAMIPRMDQIVEIRIVNGQVLVNAGQAIADQWEEMQDRAGRGPPLSHHQA